MEQVDNKFCYAGEQYDTVTGQIYLRARYYDPSIGRFTQEDPYRGDGLNLYAYVSNNPVKYIDPTGLAKCAAAQNFDKALDGIQMVLNIAGFIPGIGDIWDALNLGISLFRGQVLDSVFSSIAMIPGLGSAIATPLKTIFNAVGNASEITKAVTTMGFVFGGTSKIVSKLDGIISGLSTLTKTITKAFDKLKNNSVLKMLFGKTKLNKIVESVKSGVNSLMTRARQVISPVIKVVKKDLAAKSLSEAASKWLNSGAKDNVVYYGIKKGKAVYTGITKQSLLKRLYQHNYGTKGKGLDDLRAQFTDLTRNQARAIEQYLIEHGKANAMNKANSISKTSKYYSTAMEWAESYLNSHGGIPN